MSSKQLIIIASLLSFCLCSPVKKSCIRPEAQFRDMDQLKDYITCIKSITGSPPYGKRSVRPPSPFLQKLHPILQDYDRDYLEALIYRILKTEKEMLQEP